MGSCCSRGSEEVFNERFARRVARRYRRRGLDATARRMADFAIGYGIEGATVLEIGGGVGEIQLELLKAGAARSVNLELSAAYDREAQGLLEEAGLAGRAERRLTDLAAEPDAVEPADVVVLHRVVCCYPDYERLLGAAADHAGRLLVFSHPPRNALTRVFIVAQNLVFTLLRREFRVFDHPPAAMLAVLRERGLERRYEHRGFVWRVAGLERG